MEQLKWVVLAIAVVMYALVIAFQKKKVWFTSIAAVLVIILGMIFPVEFSVFPKTYLRLRVRLLRTCIRLSMPFWT